jgi:non-ribosomal peptide synthetase component F/pimeloyl-ACP methyl ester carboxylesterase
MAEQGSDVYVLPASLGQERFWGLDRLRPGNPTWSVPVRFRLAGQLNSVFVVRAFNEIVRRHEVLRTTFTIVDGEPAQVIKPDLAIDVPITDLRHLAKQDRDAEADRLSFQEARWQFDLSVGPLFRVSMLRVQDDEHILLVTPHHSIIDYISIGLISNELGTLYEAYARGTEPNLPELSVQYGDFAIWQREQVHGEPVQRELEYWKRQLKDIPLLDFPTDKPRGESPSYDATITSLLLPVALTDSMRDIGNRNGATFFSTMLAALAVVMNQYTSQTDFGVATQVAGRISVEVEPLLGIFVNNVVLRMNLTGNPTFSELLSRVQDTGTQALANQTVRFEQVLKELRPKDYPSHHTLFRLNFICQRDPVKPLEFAGVKLTVIPSKSQGALYDLNVFLVLRNEGWRLACEYNTDLYDLSTITQLLGDYRTILESIVRDPDCRICDFPISQGASKIRAKRQQDKQTPISAQPLGESTIEIASSPAIQSMDGVRMGVGSSELKNGEELVTEAVLLPASAAQRRFWALEEMMPGTPALNMRACVQIDGEVSYEDLEKSFQALVNRHEALRTTFRRVDGDLFQLVSAFQPVALSMTSLEHVAQVERQEKLWEAIRSEAGLPFDLIRGPLVRARLFRLGQADHVLMITTHHILVDGWSQSVIQRDLWSIYEAVHDQRPPNLLPLEIHYGDFAYWQREWLESDAATEQLAYWKKQLTSPLPVLNFPTDKAASGRSSSAGSMESLLLPEELVAGLKRLTETEDVTMFVVMLTAFAVVLYRHTGKRDMLIASPVANRGPETETVVGPFASPLLMRLRFEETRTLGEFLLRVREVVVEALSHTEFPFEVLLDNIDVRSVNGRSPVSQFYFFFQKAFLQPRELRGLTISPLPDIGMGVHSELQMGVLERGEGVRAQLEYNSELFLSTTVDRLLEEYRDVLTYLTTNREIALGDLLLESAPEIREETVSAEPAKAVALNDDTERELAKIWEQVLGIKNIGRTQNYFDLGGNSLLAVRLFAEIEKRFQVRLPLSALLSSPTVAQLSNALRPTARPLEWSPLVKIQGEGSRPPLFCAHGGGGNVLIYRALAKHLGFDQPFYGLQCKGLDGACPPLTRIEEMAELYVSEIQKIQPHGPYHLGGYCLGGTIALEMAQQLRSKGEDVGLLALFDTWNWYKIPRASALTQAFYHLQKVLFHVRNFSLLDFDGKKAFLGEKLTTLRSRLQIWKGAILRRMSAKEPATGEHSRILARIWETNDRACLEYRAKPYAGTLLDFRPIKQYSKYGGEKTSCGSLTANHEMIRLPVYPAGMLLEPFVRDLASALRLCMDRAIAQEAGRRDRVQQSVTARAG